MLHIDEVCDRPGLLDLDAALNIALAVVTPVKEHESVPLRACAGRITAAPATSAVPLPPFDQSAVDGYGIHAEDVAAASTGPFQILGRLAAGSHRSPVLSKGETVRLLTGAAVPKGLAAVVMEEKATATDQTVSIGGPAEPGLNIRRAGEDVAPYMEIIERGALIDARHVAILAASGAAHLSVKRRIKVAVLSTGDELVRAGRPRQKHQIYDSNGPMLQALFASPALELRSLDCCPDDPARLTSQIGRAACAFDLLICSGGVSGSAADHVMASVLGAGGSCTKLSLALKPGKPLAVGRIGPMAVLALPANPVAALVGALLFARPILQTLAGQSAPVHATVKARAAATFAHRLGRTEFVPVRIVGHDAEGMHLL
jgi:molybdopterin molybdotransferase